MMKLSSSMIVFAVGCAASAPGMPGEGSGDGSGSGSGTVPLSIEGKYSMQSDFNIEANMPGTAGAVVRGFIDATDSPDDPTRFILDKLIAQLPSGTIKNALQGAEPFVAGYLNDRLLDVAPDFVTNILDAGDKFGQMAKHFGTLSELDVAANGVSVHVVHGVHFKVDTTELDFLFKDYGLKDVTANNVMVTLDKTGTVTVAAHKLPLAYGAMLRLGVDDVLIPMIDPTAVTLGDVLHDWVNCQMVGQYVYDAIGIGSASTFESACLSGLTAAGAEIYHLIDNIDSSALEFDVAGTAKALDKNNDHKADVIQTGKWSGQLNYAGTPAPLSTATFTGARM